MYILESKKDRKKKVKNQIAILKMSDTCLFNMKSEDFNKNNNLNIDTISIFQEIEQELSKKLINQGSDGDSTDGPLNLIENLTNNLQTEFEEILGEDADKKTIHKVTNQNIRNTFKYKGRQRRKNK